MCLLLLLRRWTWYETEEGSTIFESPSIVQFLASGGTIILASLRNAEASVICVTMLGRYRRSMTVDCPKSRKGYARTFDYSSYK